MKLAHQCCLGMVALLGLLLCCESSLAQEKKPAAIVPAEKLPEGWDEIDQRLVFLMVKLANVETSLEAVEKALSGGSSQQTKKTSEARRAEDANEKMNQKGGGPVHWSVFYGRTAEKFFYHPTDRNSTYHTTTVLSPQPPANDNQTAPGIPSRQGLPVHQRPPQFDYIYRSNETTKARAEQEIAKLRNKQEALQERRQRLELEQSALWCEIAFRAVAHFDLHKKPLLRFEPLADAADRESKQRAEVLKTAAGFLRVSLSIIDAAEKDQTRTFRTIKATVSTARDKLDDAWLLQGIDVTDKKSTEGKFAALAKRLTDVSKNLSDSHQAAAEGDREKDRMRKEAFRELLQESLINYAQVVLALNEMFGVMIDEGKYKPDLEKPVVMLATDIRIGGGSKKKSRELAAWVFAQGGKIEIDGEKSEISSPADLPAGDFTITTVDFDGCKLFGDDDIARIVEFTEIKSLILRCTAITNRGLIPVSRLSSLEFIRIGFTNVTDDGVVYLNKLTELRYLGLAGTKVTDAVLPRLLSNMTKLESIDITGSKISAAAVKKACPNCEIIRPK